MFKSMHCSEMNVNGIRTYTLTDSSFKEQIQFDFREYTNNVSSVIMEVLLIKAYIARKMSVSRNLGLFYVDFLGRTGDTKPMQSLEKWRRDLDRLFPELEYTNKYYKCVLRHIKQLSNGRLQ